VKSRTPVTRRVDTAWPALRARSANFDSPAPNATGIIEAIRCTTITSSANCTENTYVSLSNVARRVDGS